MNAAVPNSHPVGSHSKADDGRAAATSSPINGSGALSAVHPWAAFGPAIAIEAKAVAKLRPSEETRAHGAALAVLTNLAKGGTGGGKDGVAINWPAITTTARTRRDTLKKLAAGDATIANNPQFVTHYRTIRALAHKCDGLATMNRDLRATRNANA